MEKSYYALIPLGIALNIVIGTILFSLKAPLYIDAVGTMVVTLLAGWRAGAIVGVGSFLLGGLLTNPVLPWFSGTQICIALAVYFLAKKAMLNNLPKQILSGICIGVIAAIVSAPVVAYLFGGVTGNGPSLLVAYLVASGKNVLNSVLMSGISIEPVDKTLQLLLAIWLIKGLPKKLTSKFDSELLRINNLVK